MSEIPNHRAPAVAPNSVHIQENKEPELPLEVKPQEEAPATKKSNPNKE
jgi:hypothetical protein